MIIDRIYRSYEKKATFNVSRINTIHTLIRNMVHYTLGFFFVYALLSTIGVPVGSLLAGAGVVGVALGLGAQGFMNDLITGFFIITEQQINVGDYVRLTNLTLEGTVTAVGIRTVQLKSVDGTVHYIPNRNITTISNTSRANMQVVVDVRILPSEGLDEIRAIIEEVNEQIAQQRRRRDSNGPYGLRSGGSREQQLCNSHDHVCDQRYAMENQRGIFGRIDRCINCQRLYDPQCADRRYLKKVIPKLG